MKLGNYNPAPFWFLNHRLDRQEISRQIRLMKECGVSGFFIHARAGLLTPYGSEEWFDLIRHIVREAEKNGLKAWLYDEDPFPSGAAGGRIMMENPDFIARKLVISEIRPDSRGVCAADLEAGRLLAATAVKISEKGEILEERDISSSVGMVRKDWFSSPWQSPYFADMMNVITYPHFRSETFHPQLRLEAVLPDGDWRVYCTVAEISINDSKYGLSPDNLNPDCVRRFIELTHERYAQTVGEYFGNVIPGIFTDEPSVGSVLPWTGALKEEFYSDHGYDLLPKIYHLQAEFGEISRQFRCDYWETIQRLMRENFYEQLAAWCEKHHLIFCGHVSGEENPLAQGGSGGSIYNSLSFMGIPGMDHITPNIGCHEYPSLNFGGRLAASVARLRGRSTVLTECFGCNAFNFGPEGMRKVADWLYALGINFLVPHGFFYSYDGWRKNDAGKSFFFQDPDFPRFRNFAFYAGNLGRHLSQGRMAADVCLINPASQFRRMFPAEMEAGEKLRARLYQACQFLLENHYRFVIVDDDLLLRDSDLVNQFRALISPDESLPPMPFATIPPATDALRSRGVLPLPVQACSPGARTDRLISMVREDGDRQSVFIYNNSAEDGYFRVPGMKIIYDGCQDRMYRMKDEIFLLEGYTGMLLLSEPENETLQEYCLPPLRQAPRSFLYDTDPEWKYIPPGKVLRSFHEWDIAAGEKLFARHPFCLIRDLLGTELPYMTAGQVRPIFDSAPLLPSIYPQKLSFTAHFDFTVPLETVYLVLEEATVQGAGRIYLNGRLISGEQIRNIRFYDAFNLAADVTDLLKTGENILEIRWEAADEFSGLASAFYLMPMEK